MSTADGDRSVNKNRDLSRGAFKGALGVRLDHVGLQVADLDRAIQFYERTLGMVVISSCSGDYAHLSFGGPRKVVSLLVQDSNSQAALLGHPGAHGHFALEVANIKGFYEFYNRIKGEGCPLKVIDHQVSWTIYVDDPDGNNIELFLWRNFTDSPETGENPSDTPSVAAWRGATRFLAEEVIEEEYQRAVEPGGEGVDRGVL